MAISFSGVWDDTVAMLRANASLFIAIAGVFFFLPAVIVGYFAPQPAGAAGAAALAQLTAYMSQHWQVLLLQNIIGFIGSLSLLILALDPGRPTVGGAIKGALVFLPTYFVTSLIAFILIGIGLAALIIPGLYLVGRLATAGAVIVAENRRNPIDAIARSFAVTKGSGWANVGLILIVIITFYIVSFAATIVFGSVFLLLDRAIGGGGLGAMLLLILRAVIGAAFNVILVLLLASLYRRLTLLQPSSKGI